MSSFSSSGHVPCPCSLLPAHVDPQCEEDGQVFFSLDDGATKFTDLIQLVEFYQLNRGVLPCKLKHPCTVVALWHLRITWSPPPPRHFPISLDLTLPKTDKTTRTSLLDFSVCIVMKSWWIDWLFCLLSFYIVTSPLETADMSDSFWFCMDVRGVRCTTCSWGSTAERERERK